MSRRGRGQAPQRPVKGFRPGREPPQVRKQQAKRQFGKVDARQERLIEMFAERSPTESRQLMRRWRAGLLTGTILLGILGALLYNWSVVAGVASHIAAGVVLFFWWRLYRQRDALEAMADAVSGPTRGRRKR